MKLTDEIIMAFVDGELNPAEQESVRKEIEKDASAITKMKNFERSKQLLEKEFGHLRNEEPPAYLIDTVKEHFSEKNKFFDLFYAKPLQSMAVSLFVGLCIGIFLIKFTSTTDDGLLFDRTTRDAIPIRDNGSSQETPALLNEVDLDTLISNLHKKEKLELIGKLVKQLSISSKGPLYNISIMDENHQLNSVANFTDSRGHNCQIILTELYNIRFITACMDGTDEWEIKLTE